MGSSPLVVEENATLRGMAILLIRHGETPGNRDRIIQFPETPLSDRGLEQAARLGERLAREPIGEIWVSDHKRAQQTAAAVERTTGAPLEVLVDLGERSLGDLRGTPYSELGFDPFAAGYQPPGGESWEIFHERVDRAWQQIEARWLESFADREETSHFAVVTHGLVLRSLFERRLLSAAELESHADDQHQVSIANTAISFVEPTRLTSGGLGYRVGLLACTAHLDADTAPRTNPNVGM
ncbi:MAG: histidine phosphatase family protein [bacterium]|nr:phosphoglycerate mutase [Deltaproteobacteria bacterium]MCP4906873.1 histidine phosphatase family protein [bacterium]